MTLKIESGPLDIVFSEHHGDDWIHNIHPYLSADVETVLSLSGVMQWIALVRVPTVGMLDADAAAENLGVPLIRDESGDLRHGVPYEQIKLFHRSRLQEQL